MRIAALILGALVLAPAGASAQLDERQREIAAAAFERGSNAYERGDYDEAEAEFRAAYAITQHPDLLYNVYTAAERAGRLDEAAEALEGYLSDGEPEPGRREALEVRLGRLRARIEARRAEAEAAAEAAEAERAEARARVDQAEGRTRAERETRMSQLRAGHATADAVTIAGIAALAAGGAAAVSFGVFASLSAAEDGRLAADCGRTAGRFCTGEDVQDLTTYNIAADASWITAAGLGATGIALLAVGAALRPSEALDEAWLLPHVGPTAVGVTAGSRW